MINGELYPDFLVTGYIQAIEEKKFIFTYYDTETSITWKTFIMYVLKFYDFFLIIKMLINLINYYLYY